MMRLPALLLLLSAVGLGCGIDEALVGAPCGSDDDCPNLSCVRTATEVAADEPGLCSEDGACVPGEQAGCQTNSNGTCSSSSLVAAMADDGASYCCSVGGGGTATVVGLAEDGTAECFSCPSCTSGNQESCMAGEARCEVEDGAPCGCRATEDALLGQPCDTDDDCGAAVCVRTLEQEAEPMEPQPVDQTIEPGVCREDASSCEGQLGCIVPAGNGCSGTTVNIDTLAFCCPDPAVPSEFDSLPYATTEDRDSVACTACPRECDDDAQGNPQVACTALTDAACSISGGGLCGCAPM